MIGLFLGGLAGLVTALWLGAIITELRRIARAIEERNRRG